VDQGTGDLYVTDFNHDAVRRIVPATGVVTTVVGYLPGTSPTPAGVVTESLPAVLSGPTSIAAIPASVAQNTPLQLVIADATENSILLAVLP
jgi:hypothetical protein